MQIANGRYGRPKGSGLDDRQRLASIAAALLANPKLKPTTAIRSLGVEDPSAIRRLRDKFNAEQGKLMADARRAKRANGTRALPLAPPTPHPIEPERSVAKEQTSPQSLWNDPQSALFVGWYEFGACAVSTAVESQSILADYWLRLPAVSMALRAQMTLNAIGVAVLTRSKGRRAHLN
jgi:hypothetical protein